MASGYVKVPNDLLGDVELPDRAFRLWVLVRARNGEGAFRGCFQGAAGLDGQMKRPRRRSHAATDAARIPWAFKQAQRALVQRGLMVVRRQGPGRPCLRWALAPGMVGALELGRLLERQDISGRTFHEVSARLAVYRPSDGR